MKKTLFLALTIVFATVGFAQTETDSIPKQLEEISVKANVRMIKNKNGNLKIEIANSIYKAVPNTVDLLAKLPGILISNDRESVALIGKGSPLIYIDNQKVGMNDLNSLSVDDIKTIEIINNPSAKYEADGKAVILITRKFSKKEGFQAVISETAAFKKKFNNYSGLNASFKSGQTEIKANFNYNHLNPWESNGMNYTIDSDNIVANYLVSGYTKRNQYVFGGSVFHRINEDDYWSVTVNNRSQKEDFNFDTHTFNESESETNSINTFGLSRENRHFLNSFANYNKKFKNSNALFFGGLQYSKYATASDLTSFNNYNNSQFNLFQKRNQDFDVSVFSARADFEKKFANDMKFEIGGLLASANANTGFDMTEFEQNRISGSEYELKEKNISGYSQLSGNLKKIAWMAGIRVENTKIDGNYNNDISPSVRKNYTNWFPKLQINIPVDSTKTLQLNYSKSIVRPNFSTTSQGMTYVNPYFAFASNINLDPTISDEISANFQYGDKSVKAGYSRSSGVVNYGFSYDSNLQFLTFKPENFKLESGYSLEFTLPFAKSFWSCSNSLNFYLSKIEDPRAVVNDVKPFAYYYSNHIFSFKKDLTFSLTGWGLTKQRQGVYEKNAFFIMDLGVSKTFFGNLSCTLSCNNLFRNTTYSENFNISQVQSQTKYYTDTYEYSIALKYTFGKMKESNGEREVDGTSRIR